MSECETYLLIPTLIYIVSAILLWTILVSLQGLCLALSFSCYLSPSYVYPIWIGSMVSLSKSKMKIISAKKYLSGSFCWF